MHEGTKEETMKEWNQFWRRILLRISRLFTFLGWHSFFSFHLVRVGHWRILMSWSWSWSWEARGRSEKSEKIEREMVVSWSCWGWDWKLRHLAGHWGISLRYLRFEAADSDMISRWIHVYWERLRLRLQVARRWGASCCSAFKDGWELRRKTSSGLCRDHLNGRFLNLNHPKFDSCSIA